MFISTDSTANSSQTQGSNSWSHFLITKQKAKKLHQSDYFLKGRRCLNFVRVASESFSFLQLIVAKDDIPHTRTSTKKHETNYPLPHRSLLTSAILSPSPSHITVSLPIISSCPHPPSTLCWLALALHPEGKPSKVNKPPELNATGKWQPTVGLSLHQSVWAYEEHLFDMTQK